LPHSFKAAILTYALGDETLILPYGTYIFLLQAVATAFFLLAAAYVCFRKELERLKIKALSRHLHRTPLYLALLLLLLAFHLDWWQLESILLQTAGFCVIVLLLKKGVAASGKKP
jgi:hypothetical protein